MCMDTQRSEPQPRSCTFKNNPAALRLVRVPVEDFSKAVSVLFVTCGQLGRFCGKSIILKTRWNNVAVPRLCLGACSKGVLHAQIVFPNLFNWFRLTAQENRSYMILLE